jgi:hypothetical protein
LVYCSLVIPRLGLIGPVSALDAIVKLYLQNY